MKKILFSILIIIIVVSCSNNTDSRLKEVDPSYIDKNNPAIITFDDTTIHFGDVALHELQKHTFTFTNTGKTPLILVDVKSTCGCTVPSWPKDPIAPNEQGEINVTFNPSHPGKVKKTIRISANTYPRTLTKIHIEANVVD